MLATRAPLLPRLVIALGTLALAGLLHTTASAQSTIPRAVKPAEAKPPAPKATPAKATPKKAQAAPAKPTPAKAKATPKKPAPARAKATPKKPIKKAAQKKPSRPRLSGPCQKLTDELAGTDRLQVVGLTRKLKRVHAKDEKCRQAADNAYKLVKKVWPDLVPEASGRVSSATVRRELARFKRTAALLDAITLFRTAPRRAHVTLLRGELYEAMSVYLDQVDSAPDELLVIRDSPEALYHSRAVDMNEHMRQQAERSYELVISMLSRIDKPHKVRDEATERLLALRGRYAERQRAEREAAERARARREAREAAAVEEF